MDHVITATDLTMRYRTCDALLGVDLAVEPGTVFALLGENGAGKTTLIRILTGFQKPTSGHARVCDFDPIRRPLEVRRRIGYVSEHPVLYDWMTVGEIGWFTASFYPGGYLETYRDSIRRYEIPDDRKIRNLSKGQRAKVALSLALAHDPQLLILDEPTSGLDPMVRREFLESMIDRTALGRTVFLSSHQISEVERVADTIAILRDGKVRLCCPLDQLKDSVVELMVSLDDPLVALPRLPDSVEVLCEETFGRQRRIVVRGIQSGLHDLITARAGVHGVRQRALTLEEIFIACTRGSLGTPNLQTDVETLGDGGPATEGQHNVSGAGAAGGSQS